VKPTIQTKKIEDLQPAPYNPREISEDAYAGLRKSIEKFGLVQPIIINKRTGNVVGGHQRLKALQDMGEKETQVVVVDLDEVQEKALNITLNNVNITGDFTEGALEIMNNLRNELEDFGDLGLEELSIDLEEEFWTKEQPSGGGEDDDPPEFPIKPKSKIGDLWTLGDHRILCGDSTKPEDLARLMNGKKAQMVFTDPPWNVAIGMDSNPRRLQREGLQNDNMKPEDFRAFISGFAGALRDWLEGDLYCVLGASEWPTLDACLREQGYHWSATIIWVKDIFVLGRSKYHRRYEPIWYGWHSSGKSSFCKDRSQDDVWEIPRPKRSEEHPTMKPIELVETALFNSSEKGGVVLDVFGGSGSTLISCEKNERINLSMEIEPRYIDVILQRWASLTGKDPVREDGTKWSSIVGS